MRLVWQNVLSTVTIARLVWKPVKDVLRLVKCKNIILLAELFKRTFYQENFKIQETEIYQTTPIIMFQRDEFYLFLTQCVNVYHKFHSCHFRAYNNFRVINLISKSKSWFRSTHAHHQSIFNNGYGTLPFLNFIFNIKF